MLLYVTLSLWTTYLIYFWISILALCVDPFLFNPHQLSFSDFTRESPSSNYRYAYSYVGLGSESLCQHAPSTSRVASTEEWGGGLSRC